jgi:hypothetical protein
MRFAGALGLPPGDQGQARHVLPPLAGGWVVPERAARWGRPADSLHGGALPRWVESKDRMPARFYREVTVG